MNPYLLTFFIVSLIALLAALFAAFSFFEKLVRHQYSHFRDDWEKSGKPAGFLWKPKEASYFLSSAVYNWYMMVWPFRTPEWAKGDATALGYLRRVRQFALIWNIGGVSLAVAFLLYLQKNT